MLKETAGKFCFGNEITLADCVIFPQVWNAFDRFNVNKEDYPTLKNIVENFFFDNFYSFF